MAISSSNLLAIICVSYSIDLSTVTLNQMMVINKRVLMLKGQVLYLLLLQCCIIVCMGYCLMFFLTFSEPIYQISDIFPHLKLHMQILMFKIIDGKKLKVVLSLFHMQLRHDVY